MLPSAGHSGGTDIRPVPLAANHRTGPWREIAAPSGAGTALRVSPRSFPSSLAGRGACSRLVESVPRMTIAPGYSGCLSRLGGDTQPGWRRQQTCSHQVPPVHVREWGPGSGPREDAWIVLSPHPGGPGTPGGRVQLTGQHGALRASCPFPGGPWDSRHIILARNPSLPLRGVL